MKFLHLLFSLAFLILLTFCSPPSENSLAREMPPAIDVSNMDLTVDPKEDFYRFANGNWLDKTEIPADEGRWGGFPELREKNNKVVLDIMNRAAKNPDFQSGSDERKAIDFFTVGMDSVRAESIGIEALSGWFEKIDAIEDRAALQDVLAQLHRAGYSAFSNVSVFPDLKNSAINSLYITPGGLGLPNRDYYTKTDEKSVEIRKKYVKHIGRMLELGGIQGDFESMADEVMAIESRIALATLTPIEARNIPALYNPMTIEEIEEHAPALDWITYLEQIKVKVADADTLIVLQPKHTKEISAILEEGEYGSIKTYLKWTLIDGASSYLNKEIVQESFDFFGKEVRGIEEMRPRWERVMGATNNVIGEAIGKVYVAETFPEEAKRSAEEMVANLIKAYDKRIRDLDWMTDESKEKALEKLNNLTVKIGYPDKWLDFSELEVENTGEFYSYLSNFENARRWQHDQAMKEIAQPVDKERWGMSPQTVNAYFNPLNNEIVFPAAILQPPFYNYTADAAVNYGGMGAVIGHEISHGFDDQGSRFDANGNMVNWWLEEDKTQFDERAAKLVAQFDAYEPLDSVFVQGKLTLGENIGDLGGLNSAYDALQIYLEENGRPENIDGFTPEQRFFISWATIWRVKYKNETLRTQIFTDPHSPGMYRAIGPLENSPEFYAAFDIQEGDELWKPEEERIKIW